LHQRLRLESKEGSRQFVRSGQWTRFLLSSSAVAPAT
jgi:hypothetical protein